MSKRRQIILLAGLFINCDQCEYYVLSIRMVKFCHSNFHKVLYIFATFVVIRHNQVGADLCQAHKKFGLHKQKKLVLELNQ